LTLSVSGCDFLRDLGIFLDSSVEEDSPTLPGPVPEGPPIEIGLFSGDFSVVEDSAIDLIRARKTETSLSLLLAPEQGPELARLDAIDKDIGAEGLVLQHNGAVDDTSSANVIINDEGEQ
jgi:hypothetical protein